MAALIGVLTLWPVVYMFIFFAFVLTSSARIPGTAKEPESAFQSFQLLFAAHIGTMLIIMGLLAFYIVHVFKNPALPENRRQARMGRVVLLHSLLSGSPAGRSRRVRRLVGKVFEYSRCEIWRGLARNVGSTIGVSVAKRKARGTAREEGHCFRRHCS